MWIASSRVKSLPTCPCRLVPTSDTHAMSAGSVAWINACRAAYLLVADPDDEDLKLLVYLKGNLPGPRPKPIAFRMRKLTAEEAAAYSVPAPSVDGASA